MRLVVFGDSIANGQHVSVHEGWVARLAASVPWHTVVNASVNGDTTRRALERMTRDVLLPVPDLVVVQFGLNDCNTWETDGGFPRVGLAAFTANLAEIVERAGPRVILHTNHRTAKGPAYEARSAAYNERIRSVAQRTGAMLTDIAEQFPDGLLLDDIHPSPAGHAAYFELAASNIRSVLR